MGLCCHLVAISMIIVVDKFYWLPGPGVDEAQREAFFEGPSV